MKYKHKFELRNKVTNETIELATCNDLMTANFLREYFYKVYNDDESLAVFYKHKRSEIEVTDDSHDNKEESIVKRVLHLEQKYISEERAYYKVKSSFDLAKYFSDKIGNRSSEVLLVICLNTKNEVIAYSEVFKGSLNQSIAHPRDIFQLALLNNAARVAISHNHPSGNVNPSSNDSAFTERIRESGVLLGIEVLDHIIVNDLGDYYSFREESNF